MNELNQKEEKYLTELITKGKEKCEQKYGIVLKNTPEINMEQNFDEAKAFIVQALKDEKDLLLKKDSTKKTDRFQNPFKNIETQLYKHILKQLPDSINLDDADSESDYDSLVLYVKEELGIIVPKYLTPKEAKEQIKVEEALAEKENLKRIKAEEKNTEQLASIAATAPSKKPVQADYATSLEFLRAPVIASAPPPKGGFVTK